MSKPTFNESFPAIRLKHNKNIIYCSVERTANDNFEVVRKAYALIIGFDYFKDERSLARFTEEGGVIESYRSS